MEHPNRQVQFRRRPDANSNSYADRRHSNSDTNADAYPDRLAYADTHAGVLYGRTIRVHRMPMQHPDVDQVNR